MLRATPRLFSLTVTPITAAATATAYQPSFAIEFTAITASVTATGYNPTVKFPAAVTPGVIVVVNAVVTGVTVLNEQATGLTTVESQATTISNQLAQATNLEAVNSG